MRINTNVSALNAQRLLAQTNEGVSRSMAKLSSGFRITRAADDAAGLAIANKFQADIATLKVANRNVSEATSLVQIAEGAATSVHDILVRMKELATQASSANAATQGTALDNEFGELSDEIDRIVGGTNYQGNSLIDGSFSAKVFRIGASTNANDQLTVSITVRVDSTTASITDLAHQHDAGVGSERLGRGGAGADRRGADLGERGPGRPGRVPEPPGLRRGATSPRRSRTTAPPSR